MLIENKANTEASDWKSVLKIPSTDGMEFDVSEILQLP